MTEIILKNTHDVSLEDFMGGDDRACLSAWVSFGNDDAKRLENRTGVSRLINFLYTNQHMTPFESTVFTFRIKTPLFVAREYHRHRTQSLNEWSGRYSEMVPEFYLPAPHRPLVQEGKPGDYYFVPGSASQYEALVDSQTHAFQTAWDSYEDMLAAGIAKEVARNVLPLSTYTYFYSTMNARNLMHFLSLRNERHALREIQMVAGQMALYLAEKMPLTYNVFVEEQEKREKVARLLKSVNLDELLDTLEKKEPVA